jgi:3-hydroxybutyryl-CoA dehydratase
MAMRTSMSGDQLEARRRHQARPAGQDGTAPAICWSAYFDELAPGARFSSVERAVGEADVIGFCALTGDWHPQHCDPAWAARSAFGGRIAHGMLVLSLAAGLVPFDPERVIALRCVQDAVFKRPVRLGDRIRLEGLLSRLQPIDEQAGMVGLTWLVRNHADQLVCRAAVQVLWRRGARRGTVRDQARPQAAACFWHEPVLAEGAGAEFVPVPL